MKLRLRSEIFRDTWVAYCWSVFGIFLITLTLPPQAYPTAPPPSINPTAPFPSTGEPPLQPQLPIPEESDGPFQVWREKDKYYLVIAVDQTGLTGRDLDLTRVNGARVADTFSKLGYKPLLKQSRFLTGDQTNRANVISALEILKDLPPLSTVIVYYSGHGITSEQEYQLWLQLYGQDTIGPGHGIPLSEIVESPRIAGYHGELIVIVDASYSGRATLSDALTLKDLGEKTLIFSSSSIKQNSQTLRLPDGNQSAFTHTLLKALSAQWSTADENADGILRFSELNNFTRVQLHRHFQNKDIPELMTPRLIGPKHEVFFIAYQRGQVQHWLTNDRQALQIQALEGTLSPSMSREKLLATKSSQKLGASEQAQALAKHIKANTNSLYAQALVALADGRLNEARNLLAQAETQEKAQGHHLAMIYLARGRTEIYAGRFGLAVSWYKKTLALQPPKEAKLLNEFGLVWVKAGLYEEALIFFEQGLKLREKSVDPMDPSLAVSLNNLAGLYHNQGKFKEAEPLYLRALKVTENAVGPDHPSLVPHLNNLARLYRDQERFAQAEPHYQRVLKITERALGPEHPKVVTALNNLALTYKAQGKYAEAEPLYRRVVQIDEANLGPTHPKVAYDLNTLALLYRAQGKHAESLPLYQRLVEIDEAALGPDHPEVATDLNNLAELYRSQGQYAKAEPLYLRSYEIMRRNYGLGHVRTVTVVNNYLRMLNISGQVDKASRFREEYEQAIRQQNRP